MSDPDAIDREIVEQCGDLPKKVALVIAHVADRVEEVALEAIAERIGALAAEGKLALTGDLQDWRRSEVALAVHP